MWTISVLNPHYVLINALQIWLRMMYCGVSNRTRLGLFLLWYLGQIMFLMTLPSFPQRCTRFGSSSTHSSSSWAYLATCWSLWCWWWTSVCAPLQTPSCSRWLSVTSWWLSSACLSLSSLICWRTSSLEPPCARPSPISWVRCSPFQLSLPTAFQCLKGDIRGF